MFAFFVCSNTNFCDNNLDLRILYRYIHINHFYIKTCNIFWEEISNFHYNSQFVHFKLINVQFGKHIFITILCFCLFNIQLCVRIEPGIFVITSYKIIKYFNIVSTCIMQEYFSLKSINKFHKTELLNYV